MIKKFLSIAALAGGVLLAKPALAQDYKPVIIKLDGQVAAATCYIMHPMTPTDNVVQAAQSSFKLFVPLVEKGGPMCVNPDNWRAVVGLQGEMDMIPVLNAGVGELNATDLPASAVSYTMTKDLNWMKGTALPATVNGYRTFKVMVIKNDRGRVDAAMVDPNSLSAPELWAERAIVVNESIKRKGEYHTRIELSTATPVRPLPELLWPPIPMIDLCPLAGAYLPITQIGAEPRFDGVHLTSWLHIQYDAATLIRCPGLRGQEWIEMADFWPQLDKGVQYALDTMWRLSGRRYKGPVAFINERTGEILITTGIAIPVMWGTTQVVVITAEALAPYSWILILGL